MTPAELLDHLVHLGVRTTTHSHKAVFTVEQSAALKAEMPGAHTKNLFLKDRNGAMFLVVALHDTAIDLKRLPALLGAAGRLSFGAAELLRETLGVEPGSVTPFAVIHDRDRRVRVVLDAAMMRHGLINFHPLVNTMTTGLSREDLVLFLRSTGHEPLILDLPAPPAAA